MLQYQTVEPKTLDLLKSISSLPLFSKHRLVGGTALALIFGHRLSIDLDFFSTEPLDHEEILFSIKTIGKVEVVSKSKFINSFFINDVKVDFVSLPYKWIDDPILENPVKLASIKDIAAMKLAAITNRGSKKDFIDIALLIKEVGLDNMILYYSEKYPDGMKMMVLRSLVYFEDAESQPDPVMLVDYNWSSIKQLILNATKKYIE
ncbi:nucleotidyl transferase AbiEii/AbiGii toxin family protein [Belliella buryatensis]|uniref:nucleotidyl transferase AbiEii/AbiGii toxin family protein n=1 Tax=Belliella buryatensis TaxID=1500549 RepID=UPI000B78CF7C|nr:nucleotidyl transferase AbiEii/AbiGii toxin family protein [Belliella buryatensis]